MYAIDSNMKSSALLSSSLFKQTNFEDLSKYFLYSSQAFVTSQVNVVVALEPLLRVSHGCKVVFHSNPIGSLTEASTATAYAFRVAFAGTNMLIRILALEFPTLIVVGAHAGIYFPMFMDQVIGGMSTSEEIATRLTQLIGRLELTHSGRVWRHTLEQVPF